MADAKRFQHSPLDLHTRQIRLCQIEYVSAAEIRCNVKHYLFEECPSYLALSYRWGGESPVKDITLNGHRFEIRLNLWDFFQAAEKEIGRCFWIDSICIDQSYTAERNHQVRLMNDIYSRATEVYIWLGCAADSSDLAMDYIERVSQINADMKAGCDVDRQYHMDRQLRKEEGHANQQEVMALYDFFARPYWNRVWVVQEIFLAQSLWLLCGSKKVRWIKRCNHAAKYLVDEITNGIWHDRDTYYSHLPTRKALILLRMSEERASQGPTLMTLEKAISLFCRNESQDVRDKVYGLQACVLPEERVAIDYYKSVGEVFVDVALKITGLVTSNGALSSYSIT